jgi:hypothetical protein
MSRFKSLYLASMYLFYYLLLQKSDAIGSIVYFDAKKCV